MKKLLIPILLIALISITSCHNKTSEAVADGNPDYKTPPSNSVAEAIATTTTALNSRDSATFWRSLTWENRDSVGYTEVFKETQTLWDFTRSSHVEVAVLASSEFMHSVHRPEDTARFAHAIITMTLSGAKTVRYDSLTAILRVENGRWVLGSYSMFDANEPFHVKL